MSKIIGFRPTEEDERIIREATRDDERTTDVIRTRSDPRIGERATAQSPR